ncbi:hypothetical protein [Paenibacillus phytorum]|uniref:hypothetical protein n=1 Tax=Paenibacillus phytorum TaxID=2654977 RepID=UPI0014917617|nr:hypothetical protein [Paenibacillus phytorum]
MEQTEVLKKLIRMTGERAKIDAKANGTYVVYKNNQNQLVKEHANGITELLKGEESGRA